MLGRIGYRSLWGLPAAILGALVLCSCSYNASRMTGMDVQDLTLSGLDRSEYEILKTVEGEGKVGTVLGFFRFGDKSFGYVAPFESIPLFQLRPQSGAVSAAIYNALGKVPEADMVLPMSSTMNFRGFPGIYAVNRATIKCKAIRIKSDDEMKGK